MSISQSVRENLLAIIDVYVRETGLSESTVSYKIHGQQAFVRKFRQGAVTTHLDKIEEMLAKLSRDWPKGAPWPKTIPVRMGRYSHKVVERILLKKKRP